MTVPRRCPDQQIAAPNKGDIGKYVLVTNVSIGEHGKSTNVGKRDKNQQSSKHQEIEQSPKFPENARKVHFCNQELSNHSQPKFLLKLSKTPAAAFRLIRWIPAFLSDTVLL